MTDDEKITAYFEAKKAVHEIFKYKADWVEIPMDDLRGNHWMLTKGEGPGSYCAWSNEPFTSEMLESGSNLYGGPIYTQRFLPRWVYRGDKHVMISVDTQTDGNKFTHLSL